MGTARLRGAQGAKITIRRTPVQQEAVDLIKFYESKGWDWSLAVEYTLARVSGTTEKLKLLTVYMPKPAGRPRKVDNARSRSE